MFNLYYTSPIPKQGLLDSLVSLKHGQRCSSLINMFTWKIDTSVMHLFCLLQVPAGQSVTISNIFNSDTETEEPMEP